MSDTEFQLVVVGAGISGLGFAHLANKRGIKTLVLESEAQAGGCIHTHRFSTDKGSFWAELGAHTCYNSYGNLLQILEDTGQLSALQAKRKLRFWLQTSIGLKSIPSELNWFELLGVIPRLILSNKQGRTAEEYFSRVIGRRNFERVLGPALDAVVCQPAGDFPADSLFRKKPRRKEVMRSFTGPEGLQSLITGIAEQAGLEIRLQSRVAGIESSPKGYRVSIHGGQAIETPCVALAVAPDVAAGLLQSVQPEIAAILSQIEMIEIESVAVMLPSGKVELPDMAGIIGREDDFYSVVSRDLVEDPRYRAFSFHFRPGRLGEEDKMRRIREVLGLETGDVLDSVAYPNRLPSLRLGHAERIAGLDRLLRDQSLALTGNWFIGLSIEDSLTRSAQEFTRLYPN